MCSLNFSGFVRWGRVPVNFTRENPPTRKEDENVEDNSGGAYINPWEEVDGGSLVVNEIKTNEKDDISKITANKDWKF